MAKPSLPRAAPRSSQRNGDGMLADAIALVQTSSLPALVQQELERMILSGELSGGAKLTEVALARRLGVSRGPVREAFRGLEELGLVRIEKNRGVFVRQLTVAEAEEIYEVRAILDEWIGRRLAQMATADVDGYYHLNLEFHDRLVAACGNAKLAATYRRLVNELSLFRHQSLARTGTLAVSTREHRDIVERIAARNPAAAGKAMLDHVLASRERMRASHGESSSPRKLAVVEARRSR